MRRSSAEYFKLTGGPDSGLVETGCCASGMAAGLFGHKLAAFAPLERQAHEGDQAGRLARRIGVHRRTVTGSRSAAVRGPASRGRSPARPLTSDIEGGHCVPAVGYNATGPVFVTWGALQQATWEWLLTYGEEAYAVITAEVKARGSLRGVNFAALDKDLAALHVG